MQLIDREVVGLEARLSKLVADIDAGSSRVDRSTEFGQCAADKRVIEGRASVSRGLQQPSTERLGLAQGQIERERGLSVELIERLVGLLDWLSGRLVGSAHRERWPIECRLPVGDPKIAV